MPCTLFTLPGGIRAIVCHRTRTPRCGCGRPSAFQCDAPSKRKSGTCDKHLCASCATEVGLDRHLCSSHAHAVERPGTAAVAEVFQPELF